MKILDFVKESREELKKVTWPDKDEVTSLTIVVMVTLVFVSVFLWLVDTVLGEIIKLVM
mgnify:FL=1